jgi:diaphanous 1
MWVCTKRFGQAIPTQFCNQRQCKGCQLPAASPAPALPPGVVAPSPPIPPAIPSPPQPDAPTMQPVVPATTTEEQMGTTLPPAPPRPSTTNQPANGQ